MTTDPDQIRAHVDALLAQLPGIAPDESELVDVDIDIDQVARRLEEAHDVLVRALESVERG